jgi:uncharacterized membrane protein
LSNIKISKIAELITHQNWQIAAFGIAHCLIFLVLFQSGIYGNTLREDFTLDYFYSSQIVQGHLPYRDFTVEYPPLTLIFITLPRLIAAGESMYFWAYATEILIFDLVGICVISAISRRLKLNIWKTLGIYTLAVLSIGPLITTRLDIIPAVITLISIYFFLSRRYKTAWALLAIGVLTKIYPLVLAPIFLLYHLQQRQRRAVLGGIISFAAISALIMIPAMFLSFEGLGYSFWYHAQRGMQIESSYASILEMLYVFNLIPLGFEFNFGSYNLVSPVATILSKASFGLMAAALLSIYWYMFKSLKTVPDKLQQQSVYDYPVNIIKFSLVAILVFILTNKVFSPQYIIWPVVLIPLITGKWRTSCCLLFIMVGLMTYFVYPKYYQGIMQGELITTGMLFLRNLVLGILTWFVLRKDPAAKPERVQTA